MILCEGVCVVICVVVREVLLLFGSPFVLLEFCCMGGFDCDLLILWWRMFLL